MSKEPSAESEMEPWLLRHRSPGEYLLQQLGERNRDRLIAATDSGVPLESLVVTARWWQLETYLRLLVYIQLRALMGFDWQASLTRRPASRAEAARAITYMGSADDEHLLAHIDVGLLFQLIGTYWDQCQHGVGLPLTVWQGRVDELLPIRHRIAHCRRPHADDVQRIEQLLRDLEPGANRALRRYVDWQEVRADLVDPIVEDWIGLRHPVARRLVEHGSQRKGIYFTLMASRLPWAARDTSMVTGTPGWFWVMHATLDQRHIYVDDYLSEVGPLLPLAGHVIQSSPRQLAVTLPAVGDPAAISDAIGGFFDAVFASARSGDTENLRHPFRRASPELDPRVDAQGLLAILSRLNDEDAMSIFSAQ